MGKNEKLAQFDKWVSLLIMIVGMYLISGLLLFALSAITYYGDFSGKVTEIGIVVIYILVCFFGGLLMGKKKKNKRFLWGLATGSGYFLVLLVVSICMNGVVISDVLGLFLIALICAGAGTIGGMVS